MEEFSLAESVERIKAILTGVATGTSYKEAGIQNEYQQLRAKLISDPQVKNLLPKFVLSCRQLNEFWGFIQPKFERYHERRSFLSNEFDPLLTAIETNAIGAPSDTDVTATLKNMDSNEVNSIWSKAIERRSTDPEGALTMARTLLESTLKHFLDDLGETYDDGAELPKLYKQMAAHLDLSPSQHTEQIFKQLLSGCHNVVEGIGAMRNKLSDAHGKGRTKVDLSDRHVELGVNMAGVLATFWVKTFKEHQNTQ